MKFVVNLLTVIIFGILVVLSYSTLFASELSTSSSVDSEVATDQYRIERAIDHLMKDAPARTLAKNKEKRLELAKWIELASRAHDVPPLLLTAVAFRESSFRPNVTGKIGEKGLVQVHGLAARGCDLGDEIGQLKCGARWLRVSYDLCGSWDSALTAYATGGCVAYSTKVKKLVKSRIKLWENLRKVSL